MLKNNQKKNVFAKIFTLMLALSMLLGVFGGQASACVQLPGGTTVLPTSVAVFLYDKASIGTHHARVYVRGFKTLGLMRGQHCGIGLGLDRQLNAVARSIAAIDNIVSVDSATAVYADTNNVVGGLSFVKTTNTTAYLSGQTPTNDWTGFTGIVGTDFVSGDAVDLIFDSTVTAGTTIDQVLAQLDAAGVAGGEVDIAGMPIPGGSFGISTATSSVAVQPTAVSVVQSQARNNTAVATVLGLVALAGISGATIALRRKHQA